MSAPLRSPFGRRFSLVEAATFLDMTEGELYALVRRRGITFHQNPSPVKRIARKAGETRAAVSYLRGGNYFFYETELLEFIERTRVVAVTPAPVARSKRYGADVSHLMPAERQFS